MAQFAEALKAQLAAGAAKIPEQPERAAAPVAAKPISGLSLLLRAIWASLLRTLTGRVPHG
jgi:hypothetical protein